MNGQNRYGPLRLVKPTRARLRTLRGSDFFFTVNKFYGIERSRRGFRPGDRDRDGDTDLPGTRPDDNQRPTPRTDRDKPKVRPETRPDKVNPKPERPKVDVPKTDNRPKVPKKGGVDVPKEAKPKNVKKSVKGLLDPK